MPDWAEAVPSPADVRNWDRRQADALGRNLGKWARTPPLTRSLIAGTGRQRRVLLLINM
ncbi:hypothetical protein ACIF6H_34005 [Streptomyces microflavus]|uniref:hypothetical protein n=1 Tax=Streptomyces microflavus TaxID=1919 RepID=UPI0037D25D89